MQAILFNLGTMFFTFSLFASSILVNKVLLSILPPTLFVGIRMFTAGIILVLLTWKKYHNNLKQLKTDWFLITGVALFTTFVPSILKAYALANLNAAHATLLGSIDPFVTALYTYLLFGERLSLYKTIGIVIGCFGLILSLNLTQLDPRICGVSNFLPQAAAIGAVLFSRWGWILIQSQLRKNRYPPAQLNGLIMLESGVIALIATQWLDPSRIIIIPSMSLFLMLFAYTIIIGNVIAYTLYAHLLKYHNATLVSLAGLSIPLFTGVFSWLFLNEPISFRFITAISVFFIGLLIFYHDELKRQSSLKHA